MRMLAPAQVRSAPVGLRWNCDQALSHPGHDHKMAFSRSTLTSAKHTVSIILYHAVLATSRDLPAATKCIAPRSSHSANTPVFARVR